MIAPGVTSVGPHISERTTRRSPSFNTGPSSMTAYCLPGVSTWPPLGGKRPRLRQKLRAHQPPPTLGGIDRATDGLVSIVITTLTGSPVSPRLWVTESHALLAGSFSTSASGSQLIFVFSLRCRSIVNKDVTSRRWCGLGDLRYASPLRWRCHVDLGLTGENSAATYCHRLARRDLRSRLNRAEKDGRENRQTISGSDYT
jgi:hypothetical protein